MVNHDRDVPDTVPSRPARDADEGRVPPRRQWLPAVVAVAVCTIAGIPMLRVLGASAEATNRPDTGDGYHYLTVRNGSADTIPRVFPSASIRFVDEADQVVGQTKQALVGYEATDIASDAILKIEYIPLAYSCTSSLREPLIPGTYRAYAAIVVGFGTSPMVQLVGTAATVMPDGSITLRMDP